MQATRTQIIHVNSANRYSGGPSDFYINLPHAAIKQDRNKGSIHVSVLSAVINRSWYSVTSTNASFGVNDGTTTTNRTLPTGYYDITTLRIALAALLPGWEVTYIRLTNKYQFKPPADGKTYRFIFSALSFTNELLGFACAAQPTATNSVPVVSTAPVKLNRENSIQVHSSIPKQRGAVLDNAVSQQFVESNVLVSIPIEAPPFGNITFHANEADMYSYRLAGQHLDDLRVWVTDEAGRALDLQYDWSLTLKLTFHDGEDTPGTIASSVESIRGYLRLMLLSNPKISRTE